MSYWFRNDNRLPQERLAAASYVIVGMITLLLLGFWKLQVIDSDKYGVMAERNRVRSIPIIAPRGRMLDRDGRVLVDNYPSFSVLLLRDDMPAVEKNLPAIADGLGLSLDDLKEQLSNTGALPKFQPIVIKPEATPGDVAFIESHRADIPLLEMLMVHRRRYLPGGFMAHASGYVGEVSEQQIEASNGKYRPGDVAGKSGLERQYNDLLVGTDGMRRVIVNSIGKEMGRLSQQEAIPGKQIQLTIDYDLQQIAEEAMAGKKGAVVALDPSSGEVLAFVSRPAPDPNDFAIRVSKEEWLRLNTDPDRPLLNRVTQAQLAPGSVFKIVMATAMLEEKVPPESFTAFCPGYATFYGRQFKCWVYGKAGHGVMDVHNAIVHSCDVFFYNIGMRMGIDRISKYAKMLGFGAKTGIDLALGRTGAGAIGRVGTAGVSPQMVSGRNDFRFHRAGRGDRDADAGRLHDWRARFRRRIQAAASAERRAERRPASREHFRVHRGKSNARDVWRGERRRRHRGGDQAARHRVLRKVRHRASDRRKREDAFRQGREEIQQQRVVRRIRTAARS